MTEIEVTVFVTILLVLRAISLYFVIYVIWKQLKIWRRVKRLGIKEKARMFRTLLFVLAVVMFFKNLVPLGIDVVAMASLSEVTLSLHNVGEALIVQYFTSNVIFDLVMSGVIWLLYKEARKYA